MLTEKFKQEGIRIPNLNRFLFTTHHMMSIMNSLEDLGAGPQN